MDETRSGFPLREDFDERRRRQIVVHDKIRQLRHADAVQRGQSHLREVVGDETRLVRNQRRCAAWSPETPLMRALRRSEIEARQGRKIGRRPRLRKTREETGGRDEPLPAVGQTAHDEIAVLERRKADANGDVEAFGDDVDAAVRALRDAPGRADVAP